jgi:hypothetical protein
MALQRMIICPYHDDSTPSMAIYDDESFYCFGCHKYGKTSSWSFQRGMVKQHQRARAALRPNQDAYIPLSALPSDSPVLRWLRHRHITQKMGMLYGLLASEDAESIIIPLYNLYHSVYGYQIRDITGKRHKYTNISHYGTYATYSIVALADILPQKGVSSTNVKDSSLSEAKDLSLSVAKDLSSNGVKDLSSNGVKDLSSNGVKDLSSNGVKEWYIVESVFDGLSLARFGVKCIALLGSTLTHGVEDILKRINTSFAIYFDPDAEAKAGVIASKLGMMGISTRVVHSTVVPYKTKVLP